MEDDFLKRKIKKALEDLSLSLEEEGPFPTPKHLNHFIRGICSNPNQLTNICWVILGFYASVCEARFTIINTIEGVNGTGKLLCDNIRSAMVKESRIIPCTEIDNPSKIDNNRNPLIYELIIHVLLYVINHKRQPIFQKFDLIDVAPPHTNANTQGIDLLGVIKVDGKYLPFIGEMKAYENDPKRGFADACRIFISVNKGEHNTQIKSEYKNFDAFTREELANNIWSENGVFSAFIGNEECYTISSTYQSNAKNVNDTQCHTLINCSTPFESMKIMFENIVTTLYICLSELEAHYD